jgi:peptidoglycan/LPS O-acetylase OafA/YrhL
VISGFLITMILNERPEYRSAVSFYVSRYLRLWPVYIAVAATTFLIFRPALFETLRQSAGLPACTFVAVSNLIIFMQDWFLFLRLDGGTLSFTPSFSTEPGAQLNQ